MDRWLPSDHPKLTQLHKHTTYPQHISHRSTPYDLFIFARNHPRLRSSGGRVTAHGGLSAAFGVRGGMHKWGYDRRKRAFEQIAS